MPGRKQLETQADQPLGGRAANDDPPSREAPSMKRERPFQLLHIKQSVSHDTVRCLRALLADAEAGKIVGVTYAAMSRNRKFFFSNCGEAFRNPAWATAMSATLHHGNVRRVFGED